MVGEVSRGRCSSDQGGAQFETSGLHRNQCLGVELLVVELQAYKEDTGAEIDFSIK